MIRLRVSTVEEFRRVLTTDYASESDLIDRIKRGQWVDGPSNWQMDAGTAWHAVLEDPIGLGHIEFDADGQPYQSYEWEGFTFDGAAVGAALKHQGDGLREVKHRKVYDLGRLSVQVEGTTDHIHGLYLRDSKTKFSSPDARDYEASLQWRFYLDIFGAHGFTYDLFDFADPKGLDFDAWRRDGGQYKGWKCPGGYCRLKDIVSFRFWSYPEMEADLKEWLGRFIAWADDRKLVPLLEWPRARNAAA